MVDLVVDACVAIKWFVAEPDSALAETVLSSEVRRIAPDFILVEIANSLWKNERLKRIDTKDVQEANSNASRYFAELLPTAALLADAADLARRIDHPVYDCLYVAAAKRAGARLLTTDQKLLGKLKAAKDRTAADFAKWKP